MGKRGQTKRTKVAGLLRHLFAANVKALVETTFKDSTNKPMEFARAAGFTLSTAQRIMSARTGPDMETVEAVASALRVPPFRLFQPNAGAPERRAAPAVKNVWLAKGKRDRRAPGAGDRRSNGQFQ